MTKSVILVGALLLCGCAPTTVYQPYEFIADGVYAIGDHVWDHGDIRNRLPTDIQALQFICDDSGIDLQHKELLRYEGTLYSLSNYRQYLLDTGYVEDVLVRTGNILDSTLTSGDKQVRLIYQSNGSIRILAKNVEVPTHILMEGRKVGHEAL